MGRDHKQVMEDTGLKQIFDELPGKFVPDALDKPITWYFSLGDKSDGKWTLTAAEDGVKAIQGRPSGSADCVLKTDIETFTLNRS